MGFWRNLFTLTEAVEAVEHGPSFGVDITPEAAAAFGIELDQDISSARIDRKRAITVPAVKQARDKLAGTLGQLPVDVSDTDKQTPATVTGLLDQPEKGRARSVTMTRLFEDLLFEGIAWWRITETHWNGFPSRIERLKPREVTVDTETGRVFHKGRHVPDSQLVRFDSPNDPLLVAGGRAIRICLALDSAASLYAQGNQPLDYFTPADGADPAEDEDIREILTQWADARRKGSTGYVPAALQYNSAGWSPEQLQMADARQHAVLEIARLSGLDPEDLGVSTTSRTYQNAQDRRKTFLDNIGGYRQAVEDRLSMNDVTPRGQHVRINTSAFLRSDDKTRMEVYEIGLRVGAYTPAEVRELEDRPALTTATPQPQEAAPMPAHRHVRPVNFDNTPGVLTFEAPSAPDTFTVDTDQRTIRGLAVPYGVTSSDGRTFVFSRGSISYGETPRVKVLTDHDWTNPIGYVASIKETDAGPIASLKIARGPAGDRALQLAEDLVLDGLSVGLGEGMEFTTDENGHHHVTAAQLREISLTPRPAYDGARVTQVAASADHSTEGTPTMTAEQRRRLKFLRSKAEFTTAETAELADLEALEATDQGTDRGFSAITEAITAGFAQLGGPAAGTGPEHVAAGNVDVTEEPPYRFDGHPGEHEFSTDVFAAARGDSEASQRVTEFVAEQFDIGSGDVADLNPPRQRPDMYVDRLTPNTPLWNAVNKGSIPDATPFSFPKFGSAAGLVDDHTEGTEPTPGSFTATSQTVTPSPVSGRVEIPREVVDQGGNPQVSALIWREMTRAYYEGLEAKVAALLAAASPTAITLTAGAEDAALVDELEGHYAGLQFLDGGFRFDYAPTHQGLYQRLAAAADLDGRKLLPIINPANANGRATAKFSALDVAGVTHLPVASLGAMGTGAKKSYLLATEDVHAWGTAPQRLDFQYRVAYVDLGIWGYAATAISRLAGVRVINYNRTAA